MIDKVKPPLGFRRMQAAKLMKWATESNHSEIEKLLESIEAILGPSPIKLKEAEEKLVKEERRHKHEEQLKRKTDEEKRRKEEEELKRKAEEEIKEKEAEIKPKKPDSAKVKPPEPSLAQKTITNTIGMKFVLIPAGSFNMGSQLSPEEIVRRYGGEAKWYKGEQPPHPVEITKPFYLQTTEVSQGQWEKVMGNNPSNFKNCGDDCPVEKVSWYDTQKFISKLNRMEDTNKYRLPTEAEWEYACKAKTETAYSFGDEVDKLGEYAWYTDNSEKRTHPVGEKKPNAWDLYDMHGNVWEWCQDWYGDYPTNSVVDPKGPTKGKSRVLRGGSWSNDARYPRSANRNWNIPYNRGYDYGFRVARDF